MGKSKSPSSMEGYFFGYEYLTLQELQRDQPLRLEFMKSFGNSPNDGIPWFMSFALSRKNPVFMALVREGHLREDKEKESEFTLTKNSLLSTYLKLGDFTEFYLDNIFANQYDPSLPRELFKASPHLRVLSLKFNNLRRIPSEIGSLAHLKRLHLTNNSLENFSLPVSLYFCRNLKALYLDNNYLDALPGFILRMRSLKTVHRHGNNDYFKSTFLWYHMALHGQITLNIRDQVMHQSKIHREEEDDKESQSPSKLANRVPHSLQSICVRRILSTRINHHQCSLPNSLKDQISDAYESYNICDHCGSTSPKARLGFQVFTFKNPYLGNTCVPFIHWTCSYECGKAIEAPARAEQQIAAKEEDRRYEEYIRREKANAVLRACNNLVPQRKKSLSCSSSQYLHTRGRYASKPLCSIL